MKILFIKQLFNPEPTARSLDFAHELVRQGHQVQVLTSFPSYPKGKIYDGYRQKLFYRENLEGIELIRVPIFPDQSGRALYRMLNYLSYAFSATLFGLPRVDKPDIAFVYHGALPVGIPAMVYKLFTGVPYVYDINDLWPETLTATGMMKNKWMLSFVNKWCQITYKFANHITVLSEGFKEKLINKNVKGKKISVIYHWSRDKKVEVENIDKEIKEKFANEKFHILYAGNVGKAQSLYSIVDAFQKLETKHPEILFTILGDGVERENLINYVSKKKIENVRFLDRVGGDEVGKYLACANILLVHLKDEPLFRITIPSKIIGYLLAGKPILLGLKGDAESIITNSKAGWVFEPDNGDDLAAKIGVAIKMDQEAFAVIKKNASQYYQENFTIEKNTKKYIDLFNQLIKT